MIVAFTGTRAGMTNNQTAELTAALEELQPEIVLHGNCIGADTDFHDTMQLWRVRTNCKIEAYPCGILNQQSNCCATADVVHPFEPPLIRNRLMVDRCNVLIACPRTTEEEQRSGTWATIRYARKLGKRIIFLRPEVSELEDNFQ